MERVILFANPRDRAYGITRPGRIRGFMTAVFGSGEGSTAPRPRRVVEFFLECEAAEVMIREVRQDEPVLAEELRVEVIELGGDGAALR
jgi:hypothetical protein